jgi:hypothetical protein
MTFARQWNFVGATEGLAGQGRGRCGMDGRTIVRAVSHGPTDGLIAPAMLNVAVIEPRHTDTRRYDHAARGLREAGRGRRG